MTIRLLLGFLAAMGVAHAQWKVTPGAMLTRWGKDVSPQKVWKEHPRPLLQRDGWTNLNGLWDFRITGKDSPSPGAEWDGKILVPFCLEAPLSGTGKQLSPDQTLWYRRHFQAGGDNQRTLLHFGAVDYEMTAWVNGREVGSHRGGNTPFEFDITAALSSGNNELQVRVTDATGGYQLHGKQSLDPKAIWYTRVSGIWQTVWLEQVPLRSIKGISVVPDLDEGAFEYAIELEGDPIAGERVEIVCTEAGKTIASSSSREGKLVIPGARFWTPENPVIYDLEVRLLDEGGKVTDSVRSYSALRRVGKANNADGIPQVTLNGKKIFLFGPLDQGWWPDGLMTPPSDEAMISDLEFIKKAGFNMVRKHVKVEPDRFYWHCDRLGILVWQDHVSSGRIEFGGKTDNTPEWTRLEPDPRDAIWPDDAHRQWMDEYKEMVGRLRGHPSIVIWTPFNEAWGQHRSMEVARMATALDPSRLLCLASGGNFWPAGDIVSQHRYPEPEFPFLDPRFKDFLKACGEMGGHPLAVDGHMWSRGDKSWGYGKNAASLEDWQGSYLRTVATLKNLRRQGLSIGVYTQTSDVETEINGLLTYDRIPKVPAEWLQNANQDVVMEQ